MLDSTILVQRPGSRELPIFDDSLGTMFQVLDLGRDVEVYDQRNNTFDNEFSCTYCCEP
ncbi:hypothetical protein ANCDUO_17402 [Ancylostoma duodenale]|uniref:Uncharacterized protein n=1 Tax=Ancylostoma duodenale TaxID=51022 RepID=A0A0C2G5Z5_9BILA|nr:hypothetical protein ANCDUO_17402 [Ancylostoma duodenale]